MRSRVWIFFFSILVACWPLEIRAGEVEDLFLKGKKQAALGTEKDLLQAISIFQEIIAQNPNFTQAYIEAADAQTLLASMYWRNRKQNIWGLLSKNRPDQERIKNLYEEALKWSQKAMELDPFSADAHAVSTLIHQNLGNSEGAKRLVEKALILKPNNLRALRLHIMLVPEDKKKKEEKRQILISLYKEELSKDPQNARLHVGLGLQYLAQREKDLARKEFEQAIQESPGYLYPYLYWGDSLPWYTVLTPWRKVNLYRGALRTVTDDPILVKYYTIATLTVSLFAIGYFLVIILYIISPKSAGCLIIVLLFVGFPGVFITQYYAAHRWGSFLSNLYPMVVGVLYILYGLLFARGLIITFGQSIYSHRFIYGVTEPLLEPLRRFFFPYAWSEAAAYFLVVGELSFLVSFFGKLFPRLIQLGQGPWM